MYFCCHCTCYFVIHNALSLKKYWSQKVVSPTKILFDFYESCHNFLLQRELILSTRWPFYRWSARGGGHSGAQFHLWYPWTSADDLRWRSLSNYPCPRHALLSDPRRVQGNVRGPYEVWAVCVMWWMRALWFSESASCPVLLVVTHKLWLSVSNNCDYNTKRASPLQCSKQKRTSILSFKFNFIAGKLGNS